MTHIFIEAKNENTSEANFLKTFIEEKIKPEKPNLEYEMEYVDGKDKLFKGALPTLIKYSIYPDKCIVIFDADSEENCGGFEKRKKEILSNKKTYNLEFELFLFPNNKNDGLFETLLDSIIQKDIHKPMLDCFYGYEACLGESGYHSPDIKTKVYAYIAAQNITKSQRKNLGSGKWLFSNKEYWDLDSNKLEQLKAFLIQNI